MRRLHEDLWVVERPLRFLGLEMGTRMTVVRSGSELVLHSPVAPDEALRAELAELGEVRRVIGPNRFHHLFLGDWQAEIWGPPGLIQKRGDLTRMLDWEPERIVLAHGEVIEARGGEVLREAYAWL